jgi:hypothetical protein
VDQKGQPVAGARVIRGDPRQRAEATTDASGRFKLSTALLPPGFLFVEKEGFRFHGQRCDRPEELRIVLTRRDEPAEKMTALPPAWPLARRRALAQRLQKPALERALKGSDDDRVRALEKLARSDPGRALEELERRPPQSAWYDAYVRRAAVKALLADFDEARSFADSIKDPGFRVHCYFDLFDSLPEGRKAERMSCLNQALVSSRAVEANDHRILHLARIARRLYALGEKARAAKLLREGQAVARELPTAAWAGYARGAFAEDLALIDLPGALALMKDLKDAFEHIRHHGNLAHKLAGTNPAEAERILGLGGKPGDHQADYQRDQYAIRVCYRMAPADLPRARKVAGSIKDDYFRSRAHGVMAQALAKSKPKEALALLEQAFAILAGRVASGTDSYNGYSDAASVAGLMLPVAERIDPALVREFFWRALSFHARNAARERPGGQDMRAATIGSLVLTLAPYDREIARALLGGVEAPGRAAFRPENLYRAAALLDPDRAAALLAKLPAGRDADYARGAVVSLLLAEGNALSRAIHSALAQWYVDDEDL